MNPRSLNYHSNSFNLSFGPEVSGDRCKESVLGRNGETKFTTDHVHVLQGCMGKKARENAPGRERARENAPTREKTRENAPQGSAGAGTDEILFRLVTLPAGTVPQYYLWSLCPGTVPELVLGHRRKPMFRLARAPSLNRA